MKKLDGLLIKSYIGPLLVTFFIALFVLVMQFLWKYVDDLIGKGLDNYVLFELLFFASATLVPLALPLAILLASIMTFGNYGEHFELTAVKASGISLFRFMRPLILFSVGMSFLAFYFSNNVLPVATLNYKSLLYDITHQKPTLSFQEGIFNNDIDGYSIKVGKKGEDGKTVYDVFIYDHTSGKGNDHVIYAESGSIHYTEDGKELIFTLHNGQQYKEEGTIINLGKPAKHYKTTFKKWEKHINLADFEFDRTDKSFFKSLTSMLNLKQLHASIDSIEVERMREIDKMKEATAFYYVFKKEKTDSANNFSYTTIDTMVYATTYNSQSTSKKLSIISSALTKARTVKNIVQGKHDVLAYKDKYKIEHRVEIHRKYTLSVACIVLFFIGAPLGSIIRKGGIGWPLLWSVIFFVVYHVTSIVGEKFAEEMYVETWQGMWLSTIVLAPLGLFLTLAAKNDSQISTFIFKPFDQIAKQLSHFFKKK